MGTPQILIIDASTSPLGSAWGKEPSRVAHPLPEGASTAWGEGGEVVINLDYLLWPALTSNPPLLSGQP